MNAKLKKLPDGSGRESRNEVCWFDMPRDDGAIHKDFGEIYWPFAVHFVVGPMDSYDVTHLPTGRRCGLRLSLPSARNLVKKLRALPVDLEFTNVTGQKWKKAKPLMHAVVQRYQKKAKA